jgi:hypothetical protein
MPTRTTATTPPRLKGEADALAFVKKCRRELRARSPVKREEDALLHAWAQATRLSINAAGARPRAFPASAILEVDEVLAQEERRLKAALRAKREAAATRVKQEAAASRAAKTSTKRMTAAAPSAPTDEDIVSRITSLYGKHRGTTRRALPGALATPSRGTRR